MPDEYKPYTSKAGRVVRRAAPPRPRNPNVVNKERDFADDELEFLRAVDRYKRENHRPYPTWKEILDLLKSLGYRKVAPEPEAEK